MTVKTQISPKPVVAFPEHAVVRAIRDIEDDGIRIPRGAVGTIVNVVGGGTGYHVEFTEPVHAVVAANRAELAPDG